VSLSRWSAKGGAAVLDQGLFAASNFALSLLLARWLPSAEYGAFAVAYAAFLLASIVHTGFLTEPMLVTGSARADEDQTPYVNLMLRSHWRYAGAAGLAVVVVGTAMAAFGVVAAASVIALGVAGPFIAFQWLLRRACYMQLRPALAAYGGGVYMLAIVAGLFVVEATIGLSGPAAFGCMGAASLASGVWLARRLGVSGRSGARARWDELADHRAYARWAVANGFLGWVPANALYLLLPFWGGLEATAALRATMNFTLPLVHTFGALGLVLTPMLVRARERTDYGRTVGRVAMACAGVAVVFWVGLGMTGPWLMTLAYAGRYDAYASLIWVVGALPIAYGLSAVLGAALRALERPDRLFWGLAVASLNTLVIGGALVARFGVPGAAVGRLVAAISLPIVAAVLLRKVLAERKPSAAPEPSHGRVPIGAAP